MLTIKGDYSRFSSSLRIANTPAMMQMEVGHASARSWCAVVGDTRLVGVPYPYHRQCHRQSQRNEYAYPVEATKTRWTV